MNDADTTFSSRASSFNRIPLADRLMHEADRRKENRERMKMLQEMEEMEECSFQPNLNNSKAMINKRKINQVPIHERLNQL